MASNEKRTLADQDVGAIAKAFINNLKNEYVSANLPKDENIEKEFINLWDSIGNPMYNKRLSFEDNMLNVYNSLRYWPKPMLNDSVVQTIILEYKNDNRRTKRI